jgi:hypothetical protein
MKRARLFRRFWHFFDQGKNFWDAAVYSGCCWLPQSDLDLLRTLYRRAYNVSK